MKLTLWIFVISVLCFASACSKADVKPDAKPVNTAPSPQASPVTNAAIPKDGTYDGKGRVTKIDQKLATIEIDHEAMPGMLMPAMKMEFSVKDKAMINAVKVGDQVDFTLEYKHPTEILVAIKKAQ